MELFSALAHDQLKTEEVCVGSSGAKLEISPQIIHKKATSFDAFEKECRWYEKDTSQQRLLLSTTSNLKALPSQKIKVSCTKCLILWILRQYKVCVPEHQRKYTPNGDRFKVKVPQNKQTINKNGGSGGTNRGGVWGKTL